MSTRNAAESGATDGRRFVVAADQLIDGTGAAPIERGAVLVEDGRIVAVGRADEIEASGARVVRRSGSTLLPGIIDSHVHSELASEADHVSTLATWYADDAAGRHGERVLSNVGAALAAGVTTIRDCGSTLGIIAVRESLRAEGRGPRLLVTGPPVTISMGHIHWFGGVADGRDAVVRRIAEHVEAGVDAIKVVATGGVMTEGSDPRRSQYDLATLRAAVKEAHRLGRPLVAHANATSGIADSFAAGFDSIDHVGWTAPDGEQRPDADLIARIGAAGQVCGFTTSGIQRRELDAGDGGRAELRRRFENKRRLADAGAILHIQSDAGVRFTRFDEPHKSLAVAIVGADLTPMEAIVAMTSSAARAVGLAGEVGVLRPGAHADLLLVRGDPLVDAAALGEVDGVWFGGTPVAGPVAMDPSGSPER